MHAYEEYLDKVLAHITIFEGLQDILYRSPKEKFNARGEINNLEKALGSAVSECQLYVNRYSEHAAIINEERKKS